MKIDNIIIVALLSIVVYLFFSNGTKGKEIERHKANYTVLTEKIQHYKTKSGQQATQVKALILKTDELQKYNSSLEKQVSDMNIKLKRLESISIKKIQSRYRLQTRYYDSVRTIYDSVKKEITDTILVKVSNYSDKWITFNQTVEGDSVKTDITTRDSITIVQHWLPYKFLFFKWGKKTSVETITNHNPHSTIVHSVIIKTI